MNRRREVVGYQPLRLKPLLSEGLLPVAREDGDLERRVAEGLFHMAGYFGDRADAEAQKAGFLAGQQAAFEGRATSNIVHDDGTPAVAADGKPVKAKPAGAMAAHARDYLMQKHGLPEYAARAIAGHGQVESGFDPNALGDHGTAIGFYQWRGARAANLKSFAKAAGKNWKDTNTQLDFVMHELKTSEPLAWSALQKATNVEQATAAFMHFERPRGWTIANPRGGMHFDRRLAYAQGLGGSNAPAPAQPDSIPAAADQTASITPTGPLDTGVTIGGGTFRPSNRDTVYGRAYDKGAVETYVNTLDAEVSRTTSQLARKFADDPQKMAEGFDSLRRELMKTAVFPQISVDFEVAFLKKTAGYLDGAYADQTRRAKEADLAGFIDRTTQMESQQQQQIAGLNPKNPNVADEISAQQQLIDHHYDEAVKRNLIEAPQAEKAKISSRRDAALGFYGKQAEGLDAAGVAAMRMAMEADFADGGIDGLDGQGWTSLNTQLKTLEKNKTNEAAQAKSDLIQRGDLFAAKIAAGYELNKDEWSKFQLDAAAAPGGDEHQTETEAKIAAARAIRDLPLDEAQKKVEALKAESGNAPTDAQLRTIGFAEGALADKKKALATDPLSYAEQQKIIPPSGRLAEAAIGGPEDVTAILRQRAGSVKSVEASFGVPVKLLKPGEAKAIADLAKADPAKGAQLAGALVEGSGPHALEVLAEFGDTAPVFAGAGMIIANGGNPAAAEDALAGQSKDINIKRKAALQSAEWQAVAGDALIYQAGDGKRIMATAASIARKRMDDAGIDPDSEDAAAIHEQAIHEAAGGTFRKGVQFGGFADMTFGSGWFDGRDSQTFRVIVPPSIRADALPALLAAVQDGDIVVKPMGGVAAMDGLVPVAVNGGFAFSDGDPDNPSFLQAENGNAFILDIEALRRALEPRVPGAFK